MEAAGRTGRLGPGILSPIGRALVERVMDAEDSPRRAGVRAKGQRCPLWETHGNPVRAAVEASATTTGRSGIDDVRVGLVELDGMGAVTDKGEGVHVAVQ